jgi:hypothetical protein
MAQPEWFSHGYVPGFPEHEQATAINQINKIDEVLTDAEDELLQIKVSLGETRHNLAQTRKILLFTLIIQTLGLAVILTALILILAH